MKKLFDLSNLVKIITPPVTIIINLFGEVTIPDAYQGEVEDAEAGETDGASHAVS